MKNKKSNFTISLDEKLKQRIQYLRKIQKAKNKDLYSEIEKQLLKYITEEEITAGIEKNDYNKKALCPECNHFLRVVKTSKNNFIGCSNFPKCKYTASLKLL